MPQVRICVCHPSEQRCRQMIEAFQQQGQELELVALTDLRRAISEVKENEAQIVVVGVDGPGDPSLRTVTKLQNDREVRAGIVVVSPEPSQELLVACMRAGCDEFLEFPIQQQELGDALERLYRRLGIVQNEPGKITAVYSAKGGTGSTTIASNLAALISKAVGGDNPCCVVDLSPQFGNVALMLDIREFSHSVADACQDADRLDASLLNSYVTRHESGAAVLPAPLNLEEMEDVDPADVLTVLQLCQDVFRHVILDLPHELDTMTFAGLDAADRVLLVCDMLLPTIYNTRRVTEVLKELEYKRNKLKLVINRYYDSDEISLQEISEHIQLPIYWVVPYDSMVTIAAANSGQTLDVVERGSEVSRSLIALAENLSGAEIQQSTKKKFALFRR